MLTRAEPPVLYLYSVPQVKCSEKVRSNNNVDGILLLHIRVKLCFFGTPGYYVANILYSQMKTNT